MNASGDSCSRVPRTETRCLLTLRGLVSDLSFTALFLVAQKEIPFQKASKGKTRMLVTQQIIASVVGIPGWGNRNPFSLCDALELEDKRRRTCISTKPCISNTGPMSWNSLGRNRFVLYKWEKGYDSSASIPAFALPYLKIFYSSCSVVLYSARFCNSNPQRFLGP